MRTRLAVAFAALSTAVALALGSAPALADNVDVAFTTVPDGYISTPIIGEQSTANNLDWSPEPDSFTYQWYFDGTAIDSATDYRYTPPAADQGGTLSATITAHKAGYTDATVTTPALTVLGVLSHTDGALSGTRAAGNTLTVTGDTWTPADTTLTYRWYGASGEIVAARDHDSYTPTDSDVPSVTVQITGHRDGYATQVETITAGSLLPTHFVTQRPYISGTASVGGDLTTNDSVYAWYPKPATVSYQWLRDGVAIPGAVGAEYIPQAADAGHYLTFAVTGTHEGLDAATAVSLPTALIAKGYYSAPAPTITGTAKVGYHLTAHAGAWHPSPQYVADYHWYVNGVLDRSQTGASYWPTVAGSVISVSVVGGSDAHGTQASPISSPTPPIAAGTIHAPTSVKIDWDISVGSHLSAEYAGAARGWPYSATWYIDGHQVSTAETYTPTADDFHHRLSVAITLNVPGYPSVTSARSHGELVQTGYFSFTPTLTSTPTVGQSVSVNYLPADPAPTSVEVKWYEGVGGGHGKTHIGTGISFVVPAKYAGKHIYASVIPIGKHMFEWPRDTKSVVVAKAAFSASPAPTISGTPMVGSTLTADHGEWAPTAGIHYTYQWMSQSSIVGIATPITKATSSTFKPTTAQVGQLISVHVTASSSGYATATRASVPTAAVAALVKP
jgi:hypothetical protein